MTRGGRALALAVLAFSAPAGVVRAQSDAGVADGGVDGGADPDAGASAGPTRTPPRLIEAPAITLPVGTEPIPPGSSVELVLTIAADGSVTAAEIGTPLREDIDAIVLESATGMRFEPARRDGVAVPARIRFRYAVATEEEEASEGEGTSEGEGEGEGEGTGTGTGTSEEAELADEDLSTFGATGVVDPPEAGAASRITLTGAELTTVPGTFGEPLRVVAALPGVARSPFGLGFFLVRGANFQNTGFFVDGFPVPILYHFGAGPAVLSSRLVTRQRFYAGGYPVSFGRFSAGVVALDTGAPTAESLHVELEVDALRASALAVIPFDDHRGSVTLAYRRSYYDLLIPLFVPGLYIEYTDYQARLEYRFDDHFSASLFVFGSDDTLDQSGAIGGGTTSDGSNTRIGYQFQRAIARLDWRAGDTTVRLSGSLGRDVTGFGARSATATALNLELENFIAALRLDIATTITPWLRSNLGVDASGTLFTVSAATPLPGGLGAYPRPGSSTQLFQLDSSVGRGTPGFYAEAILDFQPVEISLGLRLDILRYGTRFDLAPDPRGVVRWHITPDVVLKAATGLFTQPPQAFQTVSTGGNPGLAPQRAWQTSAGLELALPEQVEVQVTGFYSQMYDIARTSQTVVASDDGAPRREFFVADQQGRAYGLELLVRRPVEEGFYGWVSYTLSRSERQSGTGNWVPFSFDQTHVLNFVASYAFEGWRFGASFQLATGRPTSSPCSTSYDADENSYDASFCDRGERLPIYHQLNVRIDRDFNIDNVVTGTVYLDVLNVYYGQNAEGYIYQYDYQRSVTLPGLPILGTIGIRAIYE